MPASAKTPNFELPQYRALDTVSMLVTFNGAMSKLDTVLQTMKTNLDAGTIDIADVQDNLNQLSNNINAISNSIETINENINSQKNTLNIIVNRNYNGATTEITKGVGINELTTPLILFNNKVWRVIKGTFYIALDCSLNDLQRTPLNSGYYLYTLFTFPDKLEWVEDLSKRIFIGAIQMSVNSDDPESNWRTVYLRVYIWRSENINYVGFLVEPNQNWINITNGIITI